MNKKESLYLLERLENDHSERITISHHERIRETSGHQWIFFEMIYHQTMWPFTLFARFVSAAASLSMAECITYPASSMKSALSILKSGGLLCCLFSLLRDPYVSSPTSLSSYMTTTVLGVLKSDFFLNSSYSITAPLDHLFDSAQFIRYGFLWCSKVGLLSFPWGGKVWRQCAENCGKCVYSHRKRFKSY